MGKERVVVATTGPGKKPKETSIYKQALAKVAEQLDTTGLPWPEKPKDYAEEYEFPQDISALTPTGLARLQSKLAGWDGYVQWLLGLADIDLALHQNSFNILLGEKMAALQVGGSACKLKETLKAQALSEVPELKAAVYLLAEKKALVTMLKAQRSIYDTQRHAASREQSRRADALRLHRS
jgi:hypothetical protein